MPSTDTATYKSSENLDPVILPERAIMAPVRLGASLSLAAASPLGLQLGNNEIQRIAISGGPAGGGLTVTFGGQTSASIAYNATADLIRQRLEAMSSIGAGNVKVTGGPLPNYEVYVEFVGDLGLANVAAMTTTDSLTGGSSPASAVTTLVAGVAGDGLYYQCAKTLLAAPTAAPAGTPGSGGAFAAGDYLLAYSYANPSGESALSPTVSVTLTSNQKITTTALGALPAGATHVNWYVSTGLTGANNVLRRITSNDGTAIDITRVPPPSAPSPPPQVGNATVAYNGTQICARLLRRKTATDSSGYATYGSVAGTGDNHSNSRLTVEAWRSGHFALSDLPLLTPEMLSDLSGRFHTGGWGQSTAIVSVG
jgi:hypothetical protein